MVSLQDPARHHASVVDHDVQLAEAGDGGGNSLGPRVLAGHVQVDEQALAASLVDFGLSLLALGFQHVADDDPSALLSEQLGLSGAHAARPRR